MSRRLHALHVGNFKAFADTQRILLKPITLVFGPNSAGKSSFIHSLALAHEAQFGRDKQGRARLDVHHTEVGGNAIDLGGFRQFVHRGQAARRVEWGGEINLAELAGDKKFQQLGQLLQSVQVIRLNLFLGIERDDYDRPRSGAEPHVDTVEVFADGEELLRMSRRRDNDGMQGETLRLDRLASAHPVFQQLIAAIIETNTTSPEMRPEDLEGASAAIADLLPNLLVRVEQFFPSSVEVPSADGAEVSSAQVLFALSKGNRQEDLAHAVRFLLPRTLNDLVKGLAEIFSGELRRLQYLGPLRSFPPRHLAFAENEDSNWYAGGGYAWDVVRHDDAVRAAVNDWLGSAHMRTPYRLEVPTLVDTETVRSSIESGVDNFLHGDLDSETIVRLLEGKGTYYEKSIGFFNERSKVMAEQVSRIMSEWRDEYRNLEVEKDKSQLVERIRIDVSERLQSLYEGGVFNFENYNDDAHRDDDGLIWENYQSDISDSFMQRIKSARLLNDLVLVDIHKKTSVTHRDVGIGISQVLPVLVMAYASHNKLLAMEQPEIHLHPALQAELGDVFIESALGARKNTFILETHSEHLVLRLLRRVREGRLSTDDISVLYVQPTEGGSQVLQIRVDEDGDFIDRWPGGFFEESFHEREAGR